MFDSAGRLILCSCPVARISISSCGQGGTLNVNNNRSCRITDDEQPLVQMLAPAENVKAISTGEIVSVSTNRIVLASPSATTQATAFSRVHATYAQYAGCYNEAQFANSPVSHPADYMPLPGPAGQGVGFCARPTRNCPITSANAAVSAGERPHGPRFKSPLTHEMPRPYGHNFGQGAIQRGQLRRSDDQ